MKWISKLVATATFTVATFAAQAQTVVEYIHTDALGSPVAVTDANQNVIERTEYEPYGLQLNRAIEDGPGYTGHVSDAATGLSYMQQRYFDPQIGRFLSTDPVTAYSTPGVNFNRYSYANNNPYKFTDPDGRSACPSGTGLFCVEHKKSEWGGAQQGGPGPSTQAKDAQVRAAFKSGNLSDGTRLNINEETRDEQGFRVSEDGTFSNPMTKICWSCTNGESGFGGTYNISALKGADSAGHTHPLLVKPISGRGDAGLISVTNQSTYMISKLGAFAVDKTDVGYRIRQLIGTRPDMKDRNELTKIVEFWNKHDGAAGGGNVSCSQKVC